MKGCASVGGCGRPDCELCDVIAPRLAEEERLRRERFSRVVHDVDEASAKHRDVGTKKASYLEDHDPAKKKRHRVGPHR